MKLIDCLMVFIVFSSFSYAIPIPVSAEIEVYASGKKYNNLREYKNNQLEINLLEDVNYLTPPQIVNQVMEEYGGQQNFSKDEVSNILLRFYGYLQDGQNISQEQMNGMKEMWEEYKQNNPDNNDMNFNSSKIKTLTINKD